MRKVLFIAYFFPPIINSGTFRPTKFVKFLSQFGWQPYVITTDHSFKLGKDETLLRDIPSDVRIWRVPTPRPQPLEQLSRWFHTSDNIEKIRSHQKKPSNNRNDDNSFNLFGYLKKVALSPLSIIQYPPVDTELYWALRIIPTAARIIKKHDIDVIFTTSAPWSSLITGLFLQKITHRPWVADMRDPWTSEEIRYQSRGWRRKVDESVETVCLRNADTVIGVTADWLADLREQADIHDTSDRFKLITNGYDKDDFPSDKLPTLDNKKINFCYLGSMFRGALIPLLESLERLEPIVSDKLHFNFVGYIHPSDLECLERSPVRKCFNYQAQRVTHPQAIDRMRASHVLLLPLPFDYYPGKVFEYMQIGRPVLAILPSGGLATDLIHQSGIGQTVDRDNIDNLAQTLRQIALNYRQFVNQYYQPNWQIIGQYDRRTLTQKLAKIFDQMIKKGNSSRKGSTYADRAFS